MDFNLNSCLSKKYAVRPVCGASAIAVAILASVAVPALNRLDMNRLEMSQGASCSDGVNCLVEPQQSVSTAMQDLYAMRPICNGSSCHPEGSYQDNSEIENLQARQIICPSDGSPCYEASVMDEERSLMGVEQLANDPCPVSSQHCRVSAS